SHPLAADLPACPIELRGVPGGDPLVLVAEGLDTALYRLEPAPGGESRLVSVTPLPGDARNLSASADGRVVALVRSTAHAAADVWAGPPSGPWTRLTDLRPELAAVDWGTQERLAWTAPDGLAIDGLLILPPGKGRADGPFPLVTLVHGGPYGRFTDGLQLGWAPSGQWLATAGYAVFLPNPRGGLGHGTAFADRVAGAVGTDDWGDILAGLDLLVAQGVADRDRLGVGGWSQGGFMTAWAVGQTDRFKAGVMGAGVSDWGMMVAESDLPRFEAVLGGSTGWEGPGPHRHDALSPISYVARVRTPVLILHGANDARVPVSQGRFFARGLRAHGVPHELVVYPREEHHVKERNHQLDMLRRTRAWFDRWLGAGPAKAC
ncbi:MAG: S9 family peptidase, partial [Chloroflexota bacterium]|nr:S9 family peptidase [Chloroflexota bacterium]